MSVLSLNVTLKHTYLIYPTINNPISDHLVTAGASDSDPLTLRAL